MGGRTLSVKCSIDEQRIVAKYNYRRLLEDFSITNTHPTNLSKVLLPMRVPDAYKTYTLKSMLILWMLISDDQENLNPHFILSDLPIRDTFQQMEVFSVSLYLRQLLATGCESIELETPNIEERMRLLNSFITMNNGVSAQ